MESNPEGKQNRHKHRGKFTQGLLNTDLILDKLDIGPGWSILDAGCGNGYMSKLFSRAVGPSGKVFALDSDAYYVDILGNETKGSNIEAMVGDITKPTQLSGSSLDLIYLSTVFHGFSRKQVNDFLGETQRLLKLNGLLAIIEIEKKKTPFGPTLKLRYSPEELKDSIPLAPVETIQIAENFYMQVFRNQGK